MKFKYHYQEQKLWRIEEDYSYQISEANRLVEFLGLKRLLRVGAFKVGFDFIFETGVEFFFFGVEEGEVSAVLGIMETVVR